MEKKKSGREKRDKRREKIDEEREIERITGIGVDQGMDKKIRNE